MIAAILLYVPAIANFWVNRLNDRVAAANTAALVLDAAPLGMVPESLSRQILKSINARAVAIKMGRPAGVNVSTRPPDPDVAGCIDRYVRTFSWPPHPKMDSFKTTY